MYQRGQSINAEQAMRYAIEIAKLGRGMVSPNPLVGCVIVDKKHRFLSAGAHLKVGEAHAEINALNAIENKELLAGGTMYVTLEPCSHQGRTGPCADVIAKTQLSKVVYGILDSNPQVSGKGLEKIRNSGKTVEHFTRYEWECWSLIEPFLYHIKHKRPFVSMKLACSLDGQIALENGESQWITGEEARQFGRKLRAHYDATFVGAGTLQYDNPILDFRGTEFEGKKENKIVILDPKGKGSEIFKESNIRKTHSVKNITVLTRVDHLDKWSKHLVHTIPWEADHQGWEQALNNLYQRGIYSLYVEGGAYVFGQMLQHQLAQKLYLFQSSKILGKGMNWSRFFELKSLSQAPVLHQWESFPVGLDRLNVLRFPDPVRKR